MAVTGIDIKVQDTVLGAPPSVDSNSMLIVVGATAVSSGTVPFQLGTAYMLNSVTDLDVYGITEANNVVLFNQVQDYFSKAPSSVLWLAGLATGANAQTYAVTTIMGLVRSTIVSGFEYRPRNILISLDPIATGTAPTATQYQTVANALYAEGFAVAMIVGYVAITGDVTTTPPPVDFSTLTAPMIGMLGITNRLGDRACVGLIGGYMSSLSPGTSIGDASLPSLGGSFYWMDRSTGSGATWINTPCSELPSSQLEAYGAAQWLFARTRPPRNGLWMNDGATANDPANALSTLEAVRVLARIVDDLRGYFTPYLNTNVPVSASGDIESGYKQTVLAGARVQVVQGRIDAGEISDARISLRALNNDMIGTRTWEVTVEVLPALSLRWIDGFVFYVSNLN